jgi:hypothetical protein
MINPYWHTIKNDIPRLLAQVDANPLSKTFGCFDRTYWHQKKSDFASSSLQHGVLVLAQLYLLEAADNSLFANESVLELIRGTLKFTFSIQHSDGSLDEWYPQERGWAGPTGYVLYSVIRTLELLGSKIDSETLALAKAFSEKAVSHLLNYEESDVLANHQAMALLAISTSIKFFGLQMPAELFSKKKETFDNSFFNEGWSLEYDGCDPGYQSATLSFLSRLYRVAPDEELKARCLTQINFLKDFVFPDYSFAGPMGSRGTGNVFHFGFEFWASQNPTAKYLADMTLTGIEKGSILRPCDQEDHYLIYRLVEFAECAAVFTPRQVSANWSSNRTTEYFPESGMLFISDKNYFGILNLKKNGTGKIFKLNPPLLIHQDSGYILEDGEGNLFTTAFIQDRDIELLNGTITVKGKANQLHKPVFNQLNFVLFRLALLFVRNSFFALHLKKWIRSKVMTGFAEYEKIQLTRTIRTKESISIEDEIKTYGAGVTRAVLGFNFPARAVPQSLYASKTESKMPPYSNVNDSILKSLNTDGSATIRVL